MPNTVPAADTGLPTINRRSALAKLGLGLAASTSLAATAIAAPDAGVSPELLRLIEAHRAANEVCLRAYDRHARGGGNLQLGADARSFHVAVQRKGWTATSRCPRASNLASTTFGISSVGFQTGNLTDSTQTAARKAAEADQGCLQRGNKGRREDRRRNLRAQSANPAIFGSRGASSTCFCAPEGSASDDRAMRLPVRDAQRSPCARRLSFYGG